MRILAMSDLHLSKKPWQVRKALRLGSGADLVLLAGDLVNDGSPEQIAAMHAQIEELLPDTPVLAVAGNHDYPIFPSPMIRRGICTVPSLTEWLLQRQPYPTILDSSGAWAVNLGEVDVLGLNCVSHWRRFKFPRGDQLNWLDACLNKSEATWRIILCHAPLLNHNPKRVGANPYLSRDGQLQKILNEHGNVISISGHTHVSMESAVPCVEYDGAGDLLYVNDGSVRSTTLLRHDGKPAGNSADGNAVELLLENGQITVTALSIKTGEPIPGIQYHFPP